MINNHDAGLSLHRLARWSLFLALFTAAIALLTLAGWQWDLALLKRTFPGLVAMDPLTALGFLLSSLSLLGQVSGGSEGWQKKVGELLAAIVLLIGVVSFIADRMAVNTALCFILLAPSLVYSGAALQSRARYTDLAVMAVGALSLFSLIGHLYRAKEFYGILRHFPMAFHTAVCFFCLALACLFVHADKGVIREFASPFTGGLMARRLLPVGIFVLIMLGYLRLIGYWQGVLTVEFGAALLVSGIIACFLTFIWYNARLLNKRDLLKQQAVKESLASEARWKSLAREKIAYQARLMEDSSDAIVSTDTAFGILIWNKAAQSLYGFSSEEAIGEIFGDLLRNKVEEPDREAIRLELAEKTYWRGDVVLLTKGGEALNIALSISATRDEIDALNGYIIVCRDMTERVRTELRLEQFNEILERQVNEKTTELRALASHLQDIREEERSAIAREVHDELGQQLTDLKMDLSWINKKLQAADAEGLLKKVQTTTQLLDETIRTVRKIASDLRPGVLDDLGLVAAIEWQTREFEKRSGIRTIFCTGITNLDPGPGLAIGLFRICQESLTNVARHSGAKNVLISLDREGEQLVLRIADDGKGLDSQKARAGAPKTLGLLSMKERALMMGGRFEIASEEGKGVALTVSIPLMITHEQINP
jgi:PAS domain S-box-containing protein